MTELCFINCLPSQSTAQSYFEHSKAEHAGRAGSMDIDIHQPTEPQVPSCKHWHIIIATDDYFFRTI